MSTPSPARAGMLSPLFFCMWHPLNVQRWYMGNHGWTGGRKSGLPLHRVAIAQGSGKKWPMTMKCSHEPPRRPPVRSIVRASCRFTLYLTAWTSLQVVLKNGEMAVNFEHSHSDGMIWTRMLGEV